MMELWQQRRWLDHTRGYHESVRPGHEGYRWVRHTRECHDEMRRELAEQGWGEAPRDRQEKR